MLSLQRQDERLQQLHQKKIEEEEEWRKRIEKSEQEREQIRRERKQLKKKIEVVHRLSSAPSSLSLLHPPTQQLIKESLSSVGVVYSPLSGIVRRGVVDLKKKRKVMSRFGKQGGHGHGKGEFTDLFSLCIDS